MNATITLTTTRDKARDHGQISRVVHNALGAQVTDAHTTFDGRRVQVWLTLQAERLDGEEVKAVLANLFAAGNAAVSVENPAANMDEGQKKTRRGRK